MNDETATYDAWNNLKKAIQAQPDELESFPREGEVWVASIGQNVGFEQNGTGNQFSRPVLVVKRFHNHMFWCVPLSTKQKNFDFYHNFTDPNGLAVSAIIAQLKLVSIKRFKRKLYDIPSEVLLKMKDHIRSYVS
jgi:mRNA interferase MazF